ncbi:MAG: hypothetical protein WAU89_23485 [Candidatus Acidiferrales bacterium]
MKLALAILLALALAGCEKSTPTTVLWDRASFDACEKQCMPTTGAFKWHPDKLRHGMVCECVARQVL